MGRPNTEAAIHRLNLLWIDLLCAYATKAKLPLASLDRPYYFLSADWQYQRLEIRAYFEQWRGLMTSENLASFRAVREEINDLKQKLNKVILALCMDGFAVVSIDDFDPADLLLFSEATINLSSKLEEVKKKKVELIKLNKFSEVCRYRVEEKAILATITNQFAKDYPGLYFKASWYCRKEVVFWPTGSNCDMKELVKRAGRGAYKNN